MTEHLYTAVNDLIFMEIKSIKIVTTPFWCYWRTGVIQSRECGCGNIKLIIKNC